MVAFEKNKPAKIVKWALIFLVLPVIGYIMYAVKYIILRNQKLKLLKKIEEDNIYLQLSSNKLQDNSILTTDDIFNYNKMVFNSEATSNNAHEIISSQERLTEILSKDIATASDFIYIELRNFVYEDFPLKEVLKEKAKSVKVKIAYDGRINSKLKKEFKLSGVKVYKFLKKQCNATYLNLRNVISIDGQVVYLTNFSDNAEAKNSNNVSINYSMRLKGSIAQDVTFSICKDIIFASNKYVEYPVLKNQLQNNNLMQFITNSFDNNIELVFVKAICSAKKSIQLQMNEFIPTESIMSLLKFAVNSNVDVRLMIPLKKKGKMRYFATRAYAKELALVGANVYLYDGEIHNNTVVIDGEYALCGSFVFNKNLIRTNLQNILIIKDNRAIYSFNKMFDLGVENSYRINNAKYMLIREKIFKNYV